MKDEISRILKDSGLDIFGFCRFDSVGSLLNTRNASLIPDNAATIISFLFPYRVPVEENRNLSLYCIGNDYHSIILKKLGLACRSLKERFGQNSFVPFCDNSPISEVKAAYNSGLGFLGKNSLLIHPKFGSFCFIGEIVTDLSFDFKSAPLGFCIGCGTCLNFCVSGALSPQENSETYLLDTSLCLSSVTQKKSELSDRQKELVSKGGLVWGCDTCSLVCPMNKMAEYSNIPEFYQNIMPFITEENVGDNLDRAYGYKGEKILLRNLGIIYPNDGNNNGK